MRRRRARPPRRPRRGRHVPDRVGTGRPALPSGSLPVLPRPRPSFQGTPGTSPSNAELRPGSTAVSPGARERRGTSASGWTRRPRTPRETRRRSFSSYGSRRPTIPRSPSPQRCSRPEPTRCSGSCGTATRAARSIAGSRRSSRSSRMRGSRSRATRRRRSRSTPTRFARSCGTPCRGSRRSASRCGSPGTGSRRRAASASISSATGSTAVVERAPRRRDAIASFDWRVAIGDVELSEEELARAGGREGAVDPAARQVARAPRERGRAGAPLPRAPRPLRRGHRARPRGVGARDGRGRRRARRGQARCDPRRPARGSSGAAVPAAGDTRRHASRPVPLPGARPRVAAAARRPARRRDPRRRHGAREDGPGDRDPRLGARGGRRGHRADARRQPDERLAAVGAGDRPLRSRPARPPPPRAVAPRGRRRSSRPRPRSDVVVTSYDVATRDVELLSRFEWDRLLLDEAQDAKNPRTKRHHALRRIPRRRALALTGTPIENRLGELLGDHGPRQPRVARARARRSSARSPARSRCGATRRRSSGCARSSVRSSSAGRRTPPRSISSSRRSRSRRSACNLTVEQASLYRATVDRWMPRIEQHEQAFDRRGAVLAMLGQLKQLCNHPELVVPTGRALDGRSGKLERLVELLTLVPADDKALVFTQYPGFGRLAPAPRGAARPSTSVLPRRPLRTGPRRARRALRVARRADRCSSSRCAPAAAGSTSRPRTTSSTSTAGGTPRSSNRRPTASTGSASASPSSCRASSAPRRSRSGSTRCSTRSASSPTQVMAGRADDWLAELDLDAIRGGGRARARGDRGAQREPRSS